MLATRIFEEHFRSIPGDLFDIVMEVRSMVATIVPDVTEVFHSRGSTYYVAERGGPVSAGVCQMFILPDHIRLAFIHGAFLPDPDGLLSGTQVAKRFVKLTSYEQAPWDAIKDLIDASSRFDPYTQTFRLPKQA